MQWVKRSFLLVKNHLQPLPRNFKKNEDKINDPSIRLLKKDIFKIQRRPINEKQIYRINSMPLLRPFLPSLARNWNSKMGISLNQWRSSIGCFFFKIKCSVFLHFPHPTSKLRKKEQCVDIRHFMMFFTLLVVCGCIEKNPGPTHEVSLGFTKPLRLT